jgi:hypothetical protein
MPVQGNAHASLLNEDDIRICDRGARRVSQHSTLRVTARHVLQSCGLETSGQSETHQQKGQQGPMMPIL